MHRHIRALAGTIGGTLLLAFATNGAGARNLSTSNQNLRMVWSSLEFENSAGSATVRCPVTVEGSTHTRTIAKVTNTLVGYLTRAALGGCTEGRATILSETLPWHVNYRSFTGTLPRLASVTIDVTGFTFDIEPVGTRNRCRARTSALTPFGGIATLDATGRVIAFRADEIRRIGVTNAPGGFVCALASIWARGTGVVTQLGNTSPITITLI